MHGKQMAIWGIILYTNNQLDSVHILVHYFERTSAFGAVSSNRIKGTMRQVDLNQKD